MSFDIPGYFLDLKTKKYFKITPHGPYSLPELRKRLQREEEEEKAAAVAASTSKRNPNHISTLNLKPTNFSHFLRQRATAGTVVRRTDTGLSFLLNRLKTRSSVHLHGPTSIYNNMIVAATTDKNDYGEMFISNRCSLQHFGYQIDPQFSMWKVGQQLTDNSDAQSMHMGSRLFDMDGLTFRPIVGTTGGTLWFRAFPVLPPLDEGEIYNMFTQNGSIRQQNQIYECPGSYLGHCFPLASREYIQRRDLFWCSSLDDQNDTIVLGGDQKIYRLNNAFNLIQAKKVKSSVFASHIPKLQPEMCWIGSRNGKVHLEDWRQPAHSITNEFVQSSSVYKIQTLDNVRTGHELVTIAMDGSIDIWDARHPTRKRKSRRKCPLYSLNGHVNESSRHLGFDIDAENLLLMASGSDNYVRIWSIDNRNSTFDPLWTSRRYQAPIPAAKFMTASSKYPKLQDGWSDLLSNSLVSRQSPGVLLFGTSKESNQIRSIEWLTSVK
ncbi:hypothetical protein INT46_003634 [Mucor plumbeus]|uniref:Uncharacterized protein n=1 Tax=Mucor plumbeus TaxID=97098 RepID=A0A8H7V9Y3_9FUNG|nr:hypothetical protein INT46_003634 [Mucor plumbeus]